MKIHDLFPDRYLKASDLNGNTRFKIRDFTIERIGRDHERKGILHFFETEKCLPLNRTNAKDIVLELGDDNPENWAGKEITLFPKKVEAFGDWVDGIRVRTDPMTGGTQTVVSETDGPPAPASPVPATDVRESDDVPF